MEEFRAKNAQLDADYWTHMYKTYVNTTNN